MSIRHHLLHRSDQQLNTHSTEVSCSGNKDDGTLPRVSLVMWFLWCYHRTDSLTQRADLCGHQTHVGRAVRSRESARNSECLSGRGTHLREEPRRDVTSPGEERHKCCSISALPSRPVVLSKVCCAAATAASWAWGGQSTQIEISRRWHSSNHPFSLFVHQKSRLKR